jgi:hypothetical protein
MDQRKTFGSLQNLKDILHYLFQQKETASLLVDSKGITRMEGIITAIEEQQDLSNTSITLNHADKILLNQIIAVNGQFRSDYSEC